MAEVEKAIYSDPYLDIYEDALVLKNYYFWKFGQKRIAFKDVEAFQEVRLTYFNGMARHEHTWLKPRWPLDWLVQDRQEAFHIKQRGKWLGVGFSAQAPREVALILHKKINC